MENNLENKARFFAQYWWQKLFVLNRNNEDTYNNWRTEDLDKGYMLLTPLSDITDEDAIKCAKITYVFDDTEAGKIAEKRCQTAENGKDWVIENETSLELGITDFLRSKGYALPWMGLSVDKLIEYGWVKL